MTTMDVSPLSLSTLFIGLHRTTTLTFSPFFSFDMTTDQSDTHEHERHCTRSGQTSGAATSVVDSTAGRCDSGSSSCSVARCGQEVLTAGRVCACECSAVQLIRMGQCAVAVSAGFEGGEPF